MSSEDDNRHFRRLYEQTPTSRSFHERARDVTPLGVESNVRSVRPYPFYLGEADGSYVYDVDGNEYLDFLMGLGPGILGHNYPDVVDRVESQIEACGSVTAIPQTIAIEVMEQIESMTPSVEKLRLANSGTEATMHAIRVARSYTGNSKIAKPEGGYAGAHDYALQSVSASEEALGPEDDPETVPYGTGIPDAVTDTVVAFPFNDEEATERILREHADDLACVILEPVMASCGVLPPDEGYHEFLRELTEELDIVLIWDEVMTGFRLGPGSAQGRFGVTPDMTTFAKVAGGGYQLAAFGGREDLMAEIEPPAENPKDKWKTSAFHGGTYNGHPVSCAAGLATLEVLEEEPVFETIEPLAERLFDGLQVAADEAGVEASVQYVGSMGTLFMLDEAPTTQRETWQADDDLFRDWWFEAAASGVLFGNDDQYERFFTSYTNTDEQIDFALEVAEDAFRRVR
ncbi:aspartate aminotransferase family protein [Natrarchaeobius chitinivorans]|uniref:Glutamate-1-semialdehyde 2,1-aminomutase n=1 Tax=Natrarchaeobius chitinivorans TaxID=1679083 RepID=A0A3N6NXZ5_NATCH|nr:aspartate aminotransferase family protein [Natrarchaeobius chitinivorans]RQG89649.1 aspartate aminotransferase family protein [Natrarchaeobius chitinivorans]